MAELNEIKINLSQLRKDIAALQQDGFEDIGLEDLLRFIYATTHQPIPKSSTEGKKGGEK